MSEWERTGGEPWWASGADDLAEDVDPFEAHRRAREHAHDAGREDAGHHDDPASGGGGRWGIEDGVEALAALARAAARRAGTGGPRTEPRGGRARVHDPACRSCPVCTLTRSLGDARPEVVEHLEQAARHLVLAARAWVDAADERTGWERIELDDDEEQR